MPSTSQTMPLGVIVERREIDNPWQRHRWSVVGMFPGAREIDAPQVLRAQPGWVQYHAATLPATLHSGETEGYKRNLANAAPVVYVLLRPDDDAGVGVGGDDPPRPFLVTVCPYEAQDYLDAGDMDESVESVPMPDGLEAWVAAYVNAHHVDEPFHKRKRWASEDPRRAPPPGRARPDGRD